MRGPWLPAVALIVALGGCAGPVAQDVAVDTAQPATPRVTIDVRGESPPLLVWESDLDGGTEAQVAVLAHPEGRATDVRAWPVPDGGPNGSVPLTLGPGTWVVQLRIRSGGSEAWSQPVLATVPVAAAMAPPRLRVEDLTLSDDDGDGFEMVPLSLRLELAPGQSLRGLAWRENGTEVAAEPNAQLRRPVGAHRFTVEVRYAESGQVLAQAASSQVTILGNVPPRAQAEAPASLADADGDGWATARLEGNATDPDGRIALARWMRNGIQALAGTQGNLSLPVGSHDLVFEAVDNGGAGVRLARTVTVSANAAPVLHAGPDRTVADPQGDGERVTLQAQGHDPDGGPLRFAWRQQGSSGILGTGPALELTLPRGTHALEVSAEDQAGATVHDVVQVKVHAPWKAVRAEPAVACEGRACRFDGRASRGEGDLTFQWDFGDGQAAEGPTPSHAFAADGVHQVRLRVRDSVGQEATAQRSVLVKASWILFEDGGEAAAPWEQASWFNQAGFIPTPPTSPAPGAANHPSGTWSTTTASARSGLRSWTAPYPDQANFTMTSPPIAIPAGDARPHALTYWLRGGVENNPALGVDGLHVYVLAAGGTSQVQYVTDDHPAWQRFVVPLDAYAGETIQIVFAFESDGFCSRENTAAGRQAARILFQCDASSYEGYFLDDIVVE